MKLFFALITVLASQTALASDPACLKLGSRAHLSGLIQKYNFEHAGNGQKLQATLLRLPQSICVVDEEGNDQWMDTVQLLPNDYKTPRPFRDGQKITLELRVGSPGDTAWYTRYNVFFYPLAD